MADCLFGEALGAPPSERHQWLAEQPAERLAQDPVERRLRAAEKAVANAVSLVETLQAERASDALKATV
jgi:hypothetical protein